VYLVENFIPPPPQHDGSDIPMAGSAPAVSHKVKRKREKILEHGGRLETAAPKMVQCVGVGLPNTGITKAIGQVEEKNIFDSVTGAVKQVLNDVIGAQRAILAEHLADNNVIQVTDKQSGKLLTTSEISDRYRDINTFNIEGMEQVGADAVKSMPHYGSALLLTEIAATKGKALLTNPKDVAKDIADAVKDARSVQEALGHLGGQHALKKLDIEEHPDFINRYHGSDYMGLDSNHRLVEVEYKGNNKDSTVLSQNNQQQKQGSSKKNRKRAEVMSGKISKIDVVSNRQGGAYTQSELDIWQNIEDLEGNKRHLASFTNTTDGKVRVYEQDEKGTLTDRLVDDLIPDYEEKKTAIEAYFKNKKEGK